jgi:putative transposase
LNTLVACDFFTKGVITPLGVRQAYCLAFIYIGTRKVFLSPPTYHPHDRWVQQQGRNLMMWLEEQQLQARFLIHDRDSRFSSAFRRLFRNAGIRRLRTPPLAPDANAFSEAWIGGLKGECLNYFLCFSLAISTTSANLTFAFSTNSVRTKGSGIERSLLQQRIHRRNSLPIQRQRSVASVVGDFSADCCATIIAPQRTISPHQTHRTSGCEHV